MKHWRQSSALKQKIPFIITLFACKGSAVVFLAFNRTIYAGIHMGVFYSQKVICDEGTKWGNLIFVMRELSEGIYSISRGKGSLSVSVVCVL